MRTVGGDSPVSLIYGYSIILSAGVGCFVQAFFPVAQAKVPQEDVSAAVAFIGCAQLAGLALSFTIAYSIFLNTAINRIKSILPGAPQDAVQAAITGVGAHILSSLSDDVQVIVLQAVSDSSTQDQIRQGEISALNQASQQRVRREKEEKLTTVIKPTAAPIRPAAET